MNYNICIPASFNYLIYYLCTVIRLNSSVKNFLHCVVPVKEKTSHNIDTSSEKLCSKCYGHICKCYVLVVFLTTAVFLERAIEICISNSLKRH